MLTVRPAIPLRASLILPATALLLLLAACNETGAGPTAQPEPMDETGAQAMAVAVVEASDARLPHLPSLIRAAREAIRASDDNAEAVRAFRRARRARMAADESLRLSGRRWPPKRWPG